MDRRTSRAGALEAQTKRDVLHEKTFRAWVNKYLKHRDAQIANLFDGLADGVQLLALTELLTRKAIRSKTYRTPSREIHKLENVSIALRVLRSQHANWRALDVEPKEIVSGERKTVLGMVWQFVLRFQILDEDEITGPGTALQKARAKVLDWWREQVGDAVAIDSVDKSFSDGLAILALCAKLAPGCVDMAKARAMPVEQRLDLAFALAQEHLGILPLLEARDMVSDDADQRPDEQCILTYVSEFPPAFKALAANVDREAEYKDMVERMRAEHEEQEKAALAEIDRLKSTQAKLQEAQETELARLKAETDALLAENQAMTAREKEDAIAAVQAKMKEKEERVRQAMLKLKRHQEEQEAQLRHETEEALRAKEEELRRLEEEKAAEVARMKAEQAALEQRKAAELAAMQQQADADIKRKEDQMEAQRLENEMRAKLSQEEFERWKAGKMAELERVRLEREALEKLSMEELQRLREENERLKRGVPHSFQKKKFAAPTWCNLCKSFLLTGGLQCTRCKYTIDSKCLRRNPPNNCIPPDEEDDDDDADDAGSLTKNKEKIAEIEALPSVREGVLVKKGLNRGNWQERRFVLKQGGYLLYYTKTSKPKLKGMVSLSRAEIIAYDKPEKRQWAFGVKSKARTLWMSALSEIEMTAWQRILKETIAVTDGTVVDSTASVKSDKAIIRFYDANNDAKMWTLALEVNARPADALGAWRKKAKIADGDYEIWEQTLKDGEMRRVPVSQPLSDLRTIREAAGKQIKFVVKQAGKAPKLPKKTDAGSGGGGAAGAQ